MIPTLVNTIAVLAGAAAGLLFHKHIQDRFQTILFQSIGLATFGIGTKYALQTEDIPLLALSLISGGLLGEWIGIEERMKSLGGLLKRVMNHDGDSRFVEAFVFASILFCTGSMAVVGCFQAGVQGNGELLYTKSLLDGHAAVFLAGAMGAGVLASSVSVLLYQGALTMLFIVFAGELPSVIITEVAAAGGLLIVGISINLMELGRIRVGNLLPSMVIVGILAWVKISM